MARGYNNRQTSGDDPPRGRAEIWRQTCGRGWRCLDVRLGQTLVEAKGLGGPGIIVRWEPKGAPVVLADGAASLEAWQRKRGRCSGQCRPVHRGGDRSAPRPSPDEPRPAPSRRARAPCPGVGPFPRKRAAASPEATTRPCDRHRGRLVGMAAAVGGDGGAVIRDQVSRFSDPSIRSAARSCSRAASR